MSLHQVGIDWLEPFQGSEFVEPLAIGALVVFGWWRVVLARRGQDHPLARVSEVFVRSDPTSAFDLARSTVKAMGLSVISLDHEESTIISCREGGWRGFGEFLQIDVSPENADSCRLNCKSWPTSDVAVSDWGAGRRLIAEFVEWLTAAAPEDARVTATRIERSRRP